MPYPKAERVKVVGKIDPDCLYTREGCMRYAGLGRRSLDEARASGVVKPLSAGIRRYYRGSELIQWIEGQSRTTAG